MKKIIVCMTIALTVFSASSFAQMGGGGAERYKQMLKDSLQLTDVQIDTVVAVRQDFAPQMRAIFSDQTLSADQKKSQMDALKTQMDARLQGTLTPDQITHLEAIQQSQHAHMHNRGGGGSSQ